MVKLTAFIGTTFKYLWWRSCCDTREQDGRGKRGGEGERKVEVMERNGERKALEAGTRVVGWRAEGGGGSSGRDEREEAGAWRERQKRKRR